MTVERWLAKHPRYTLEHLDILEKHQRSSGNPPFARGWYDFEKFDA
jgi:hypothetical protein